MEHQYPGAISGDEGMLAELMLPDQVHNRKEDWTVFFLHKEMSEEDPEGDKRDSKIEPEEGLTSDAQRDVNGDAVAGANDRGEDQEDDEGREGPPLIYVLNLVNTKHDASAKRCVVTQLKSRWCLSNLPLRRGAVVKAMAICTRHPFLHIYKVK